MLLSVIVATFAVIFLFVPNLSTIWQIFMEAKEEKEGYSNAECDIDFLKQIKINTDSLRSGGNADRNGG